MTPLFKAKCIYVPWNVSSIQTGSEYDVYRIDLVANSEGHADYYFLVLTKNSFATYKAEYFTYETKLEKAIK